MAIARIAGVLLFILAIHWIGTFASWFFVLLALAAVLLLASHVRAIPGLPGLAAINTKDRLALWIVLAVLAVIGYLHNLNTWTAAGHFNRPADVALWKTELILGISLAAPLMHWMAGAFLPRTADADGRRFASEFALFVNFSGIAIVLWTGEAGLTLTTFGAVLALVVLAELALYAST